MRPLAPAIVLVVSLLAGCATDQPSVEDSFQRQEGLPQVHLTLDDVRMLWDEGARLTLQAHTGSESRQFEAGVHLPDGLRVLAGDISLGWSTASGEPDQDVYATTATIKAVGDGPFEVRSWLETQPAENRSRYVEVDGLVIENRTDPSVRRLPEPAPSETNASVQLSLRTADPIRIDALVTDVPEAGGTLFLEVVPCREARNGTASTTTCTLTPYDPCRGPEACPDRPRPPPVDLVTGTWREPVSGVTNGSLEQAYALAFEENGTYDISVHLHPPPWRAEVVVSESLCLEVRGDHASVQADACG